VNSLRLSATISYYPRMSSIVSIEDYSERAVVLRGDTKDYKTEIATAGGKYNPNLRGNPGWVFPKTKIKAVEELANQINDGGIAPTVSNEKAESKTYTRPVSKPVSDEYKKMVPYSDYLALLSRVERLEAICSQIDFVEDSAPPITTRIVIEEEEEKEVVRLLKPKRK
jgi:hypothetical protein